jgi:leucyl/phenylalanyl-tRNA--protein transferase
MSLYILDKSLWFPPADEATEEGLLAIGGDLSEQRLLLAYRNGIFPWFEDDVPLWWCPDPRFVLFPDEVKISKSMQRVVKKNEFEFRINHDFGK